MVKIGRGEGSKGKKLTFLKKDFGTRGCQRRLGASWQGLTPPPTPLGNRAMGPQGRGKGQGIFQPRARPRVQQVSECSGAQVARMTWKKGGGK